jgi:hypothetical protein
MTRHCGPEKRIELRLKHEVPEAVRASQRREKAAEALWHRLAPDHRITWEEEPH